jgi:hypothetical protein
MLNTLRPIGLTGRIKTQWELKSPACIPILYTFNCFPPSTTITKEEHRQVCDNPNTCDNRERQAEWR